MVQCTMAQCAAVQCAEGQCAEGECAKDECATGAKFNMLPDEGWDERCHVQQSKDAVCGT